MHHNLKPVVSSAQTQVTSAEPRSFFIGDRWSTHLVSTYFKQWGKTLFYLVDREGFDPAEDILYHSLINNPRPHGPVTEVVWLLDAAHQKESFWHIYSGHFTTTPPEDKLFFFKDFEELFLGCCIHFLSPLISFLCKALPINCTCVSSELFGCEVLDTSFNVFWKQPPVSTLTVMVKRHF